MKIKNIIKAIYFLPLLILSCGDRDLDPTLGQSKDLSSSIKTASDLKTVLNSAYSYMKDKAYYGRDYIIFGEVRSDNAYSNSNSNRFTTVGQMSMISTDGYANDTWQKIYQTISIANIIIGKSSASISGDQAVINHTLGEAYAIRALAHFDLLKLYGQQSVNTGGKNALGVPYVTTFKDPNNLTPARNTVQEDYNFAIADLNKAISLMDPSNDDASGYYLTYYGAQAVKARLALYFKDYQTAETAAAVIINSGKYSIATEDNFAGTFSKFPSSNQIFSIAQSSIDNNGIDGLAYIYQNTTYGDIVILKDLYDTYEASDVRRALFATNPKTANTYRNIGKYPAADGSSSIPVIRYEEIVLTYAEALFYNGKTSQALDQLNLITKNRKASSYANINIDNILKERRKELAGEGFRFYDLARTGNNIPLVDPIHQTFGKTIIFGSYNYAFPIPNKEIGANSKIIQNSGY